MDLKELDFFILGLKRLKRRGWAMRGIPEPESVAEHSYAVSLLSFAQAEKMGIDSSKCLRLAIVHDLQESISNDITPHDNISLIEKSQIEEKSMKEISMKLKSNMFYNLWIEYEENRTKEAKLVHDMDKIEMLYQALDYERSYPEKDLSEFFDYVKDRLQLEESKKIFSGIIEDRIKNKTLSHRKL